ncbi:hypothetical protein PQJ75_00975 [Rhodoplanes sp. TEM]|uniref:Uncharacterized protein n=1 Tax=Rhodoplanes tepidamans TaxID=200616 RepID=A0ABT5J5C1_RHOTP|nr:MULTISPECIES: hypothetical protein [Rhodoplanes]MDC7784826.1 hypothetical protein [Rhodoplanes tepidamans]MDC7982293.1 hypothetical protein [Rhodoplanes sp. TEM]MDQ0356301.1 hypothetical protein [Rhodoplanes tepidamans]
MGDMGDDFRAWREHKRQRAAEFRARIPAALKTLAEAGIRVRCLDHGEHYRVDERFDWWPSTGRWRSLDGKQTGFRVRSLIAAVTSSK